MKEQFETIILPKLPIIGSLKILKNPQNIIVSIQLTDQKHSNLETSFASRCYEQFTNYLSGNSKEINLPVQFLNQSSFQKNILEEIKKIPYGETRTYKDIGNSINSKGYQAIGGVCKQNPILFIYPCHRVVGIKSPYQFVGGESMKKELLSLESKF